MKRLEFRVKGIPAPKGSMRGRAGGGKPVPGGSRVNENAQKDWGKVVRDEAELAKAAAGFADRIMFVDVPIRLKAIWYYRRPKSHFVKKGPNVGAVRPDAPRYPKVAPDTSKVLRSFEDHLNLFVWDDDSRVVETQMRKEYAPAPNLEGAKIIIEEMEEP